jgi:hypothetical protein
MCEPRRHSRGVQQSQSRRQECQEDPEPGHLQIGRAAHGCSSMKTSFLTRFHWTKSLVQSQSLFVCQGIIYSRCEGLNSARRGESQTREIPIWSAVHYTTTWLVHGNARLECTTNKHFIATVIPPPWSHFCPHLVVARANTRTYTPSWFPVDLVKIKFPHLDCLGLKCQTSLLWRPSAFSVHPYIQSYYILHR